MKCGLTGRSTRTRSGIAPRSVLVSVRLAAQCRCVPVNSNVKTHMPTPANYKQVLQHFEQLPEDVRKYFPTFKELVERYSWDVSVAYVFSWLLSCTALSLNSRLYFLIFTGPIVLAIEHSLR